MLCSTQIGSLRLPTSYVRKKLRKIAFKKKNGGNYQYAKKTIANQGLTGRKESQVAHLALASVKQQNETRTCR